MRYSYRPEDRAIVNAEGIKMIKITDKAFRYTTSFNTDLRKKFRKLAQEQRAAAASSTVSEAAMTHSVVSIAARRSMPKG